jgi:putative phosphoesterase
LKLAIFSDTHGRTAGMVRAVRRVSPDVLVHLGDYHRDAEALEREFPELPLHAVPGNCDYADRTQDTLSFLAGQVTVFATHGHRYFVKYGTDSLLNAAYFSSAGLVLYGHTHIAQIAQAGGMVVLNPGSAGTGAAPTFAVAEIGVDGSIVCRILDI